MFSALLNSVDQRIDSVEVPGFIVSDSQTIVPVHDLSGGTEEQGILTLEQSNSFSGQPEKNPVPHIPDYPYQPSVESTWRPLVFGTAKEAYQLYENYARAHGFAIRVQQQHKTDSKGNKVDYVFYGVFECYKAGFKQLKKGRESPPVNEREIIRTGCHALMRVRFFKDICGYKITCWKDEHNHSMVEAKHTQYLPQNRQITQAQEDMIDLYVSTGISQRATYESMSRTHGGRENLSFLRVDMKNMLNKKRQIQMAPGEGAVLLQWFREQGISNPGFFYDIQHDEDDAIASIFWADPIMRADYASFGDFVSFDVTYRTNKDYRPLAVFCGFNHHKATCVFGAALLYDECIESIGWIFDAFLRCMNEKMPVTLMTDQAPAIAAAAKAVFPDVFHGLCSWHILQNAKKNMPTYAADPAFMHEFHHLINHVDDPEQFEYSWSRMMVDCFQNRPLKDFPWLQRTYPLKKKWSSAWRKKVFTAGKTTTQLSEQLNSYSRNYLKPDHSIAHFFIRFADMLKDLRQNEDFGDFRMVVRVPNNRYSHIPFMVQAAEVYTAKIFKIFQDQYDLAHQFNLTVLHERQRGSTQVILCERRMVIHDKKSPVIEEHTVEVDLEARSINCTCLFFENCWILCRHSLRVMEGLSMFNDQVFRTIPDQYMKARWMKDCKKDSAVKLVNQCAMQTSETLSGRYQQWCALMVAAGSTLTYNSEAYDFVLGKVVQAMKEAEPLIKSQRPPDGSSSESEQPSSGEKALPKCVLKKRKNPITSKVRFKTMSEKFHLEKKQKCKEALKRKELEEVAEDEFV